MFGFDPLTIGVSLLVWLAFRNQSNTQFGVMTPQREEVYRNALEKLKDPEKMRALANEFTKFGLKAEASMLRRRAAWRGRSPELRQQHEDIFQRALASSNIDGILRVAAIFEEETATLKAARLRQHAKEVLDKEKATAANAAKSQSLRVVKDAESVEATGTAVGD